MRVVQPRGTRGSLKWIQKLVSENQVLLDNALRDADALSSDEAVRRVSPRRDDEWAEYRDRAFLEQIGREGLDDALRDFWPRGGPQWDALGVSSKGTALLIEAKAHVAELGSTCQASALSRKIIEQSFADTKNAFGVRSDANWFDGYYQYANRLAHLHFFQRNHVPAALVFLYFTSDEEMRGPHSRIEWEASLVAAYRHLGIVNIARIPNVFSVYIDVKSL